MKCIALYHVRFEDLGNFAEPLERAGYDITYRHAGAAPLSLDEWRDTDLVVVLGGPIGASDTDSYPWLADEIIGLALRLSLERPTLGICLGAQLMAVALGGKVVRRRGHVAATALEIGWSRLDIGAAAGPLEELRAVEVMHWHGDNIVLPVGVLSGASTPGTPCQAFQLGKHALAIQFHAEFQGSALEEWLTGHAVELACAGLDLQTLREGTARHADKLAAAGASMLRCWLAELTPAS